MCFESFSLHHSSRFCLSSYHAETSKNVSKSVPKKFQNRAKSLFEITCVLETRPGEVWRHFGLPHGSPKHVFQASSRLSKTFSSQFGLPGTSRMECGGYLHPLALAFEQFGTCCSLKTYSEVCLSHQFYIAFRGAPNASNVCIRSRARYLSCNLRHLWPNGRLILFSHLKFRSAMPCLSGLASGTPSAAIWDPN